MLPTFPPTVMPIEPPQGFLTRPEASKLFNRSQRALERDLDVALVTEDADTLQHWKLFTKDGEIRGGEQVNTDFVKQLVADGMSPTWCVEGEYLEERFGRKGDPKPSKVQRKSTQASAHEQSNRPSQDSGPRNRTPDFPQDLAFLKDQIRTLQQEKQQEQQRHDHIVGKLFEQLAVKDKQISAWDEVTQGLTRGLATGQITPNLLPSGGNAHAKQRSTAPIQSSEGQSTPGTPAPVEVSTNPKTGDRKPTKPGTVQAARSKPRRKNNGRRTKNKTASKSTSSTGNKQKPARKPPKQTPKPKWYDVPTFKRFLSRK